MTYMGILKYYIPSLIISLFCTDDEASVNLAYLLGNKEQREIMGRWYWTSDTECDNYPIPFIRDSDMIYEIVRDSGQGDHTFIYLREEVRLKRLKATPEIKTFLLQPLPEDREPND